MSDYSTFAPFYDLLLKPFLGDIRQEILKTVNRLKPRTILDVCCGTGDQLKLLKKNAYDVVGIDLSASMLKVAKKGTSGIRCENQDATQMTFPENHFDLAMITLALHETEWDQAKKILGEMHRVIKPGGHALIVDYAMGEKTGFFVSKLIYFIEFIAGKRHFDNYIFYNKSGGLENLVDPTLYELIWEKPKGLHSLVIKVLQKKNLSKGKEDEK